MVLQSEGKKPYFQNILSELERIGKDEVIYPAPPDIFAAFSDFELYETNLIFLGQDPYPNGHANGYAFSSNSEKTPMSLRNIFKELKKDYPEVLIQSNNLKNWSRQKVLLLNTVLTVSKNKPDSHKNIGWESFTLKVVDLILGFNKDCIIVALGNKARDFVSKLENPVKNLIFLSHPSPLSYNKSFKDSKLFLKINNLLKEQNKPEISWDIKGEYDLFT